MPYIDLKVTVDISDMQKESLKSGFGKTIRLASGKNESQLMVCIEDEMNIWLAGKKLEKGANVSIEYLGDIIAADLDKLSDSVYDLLACELDISPENVYIEYKPVYHWGAHGRTVHVVG